MCCLFIYIVFFVMVAFSIGNIHIYWYGIFYLVWFLVAYLFLSWVAKTKIFKWQKKVQDILEKWLEDLFVSLILWVIIWWRLWEVFIYEWPYFSTHLSEIFAVWHGWMSFFGWIIWVLVAIFVFSIIKKLKFNDVVILLGLLIVVVPFAIMLWRFGNYLNQELYWVVVPQSFMVSHESLSLFLDKINIFHVYNQIDENIRVNTNFLAIIFEWFIPLIVGIVLFVRQLKKRLYSPYLNIWVFVLLYSIARFVLEYFRAGSQTQFVWIFTKSQWIFLVFFVVWICLLCVSRNKKFELWE